jgi:hypothetical protein
MSSRRKLAGLAILAGVALGCAHGVARSPRSEDAALRVDSAEYTVRLVGQMYQATIGFVYTNQTGGPVSQNYCRAPSPPVLEKKLEDGRWVQAYDMIVMLTCKTSPPFRLAAGESYRNTFHMAVAKPGARIEPVFALDSVPGIYRLRWVLRSGPDPDDRRATTVEAISPSFRLLGP